MSTQASTPTKIRIDDYGLDDLLTMANQRRASDLHLTAGLAPMLRIDGLAATHGFRAAESAGDATTDL